MDGFILRANTRVTDEKANKFLLQWSLESHFKEIKARIVKSDQIAKDRKVQNDNYCETSNVKVISESFD